MQREKLFFEELSQIRQEDDSKDEQIELSLNGNILNSTHKAMLPYKLDDNTYQYKQISNEDLEKLKAYYSNIPWKIK